MVLKRHPHPRRPRSDAAKRAPADLVDNREAAYRRRPDGVRLHGVERVLGITRTGERMVPRVRRKGRRR